MADSPHSAGSPQVSRAVDRTPKQIPLALDYAPPKVRAHGLRDAHWRPLAAWSTDGPSFRTSAKLAWHFPLLELGRTPNSFAAVILDIDGREPVIAFMDSVLNRRLPQPNFMVERLQSGNVQASYCLARPVHRGRGARERPLRALVRFSEWLTLETRADQGFVGVLARNPLEEVHRVPLARDGSCRTIWGRSEPYPLSELTNLVPLGWKRPKVAISPIGRNATLFRNLMRETGKPSNWGREVLPLALAMADGIRKEIGGDHPFTDAEVRHTAASVERIQRANLASGATQAGLKERQAERGRRSGKARRRGSIEEEQPWTAAGVSRATWYRRRVRDAQLELLHELQIA